MNIDMIATIVYVVGFIIAVGILIYFGYKSDKDIMLDDVMAGIAFSLYWPIVFLILLVFCISQIVETTIVWRKK